MSISTSRQLPRVRYEDGTFILTFDSGVTCSFPIAGNRRLSAASAAQLANVRVSRSGLHWPDVDEDLSFEGLMRGDYGQFVL